MSRIARDTMTTVPRTLAAIVLTASVAGLVTPAIAKDDEPEIARYLRIRTPSAPDLAADGSVYVRDWPDGVFQLYRREPGESPESLGTQLTSFEDGVSGFTVSPDGSTLLVTASTGGSEQNDIHVLDAASREIKPLFVDPEVVYSPQLWLRHKNGFVYTANDESSGDFHLYTHDLDTGESAKLLSETGYWYAGDATADGSRFLVGRYFSASQAELYELDAETGHLTDLSIRTDDGDAIINFPVGYTPDERSVLFITDMDDGKRKLFVREIASGAMREVFPDLGAHEVADVSINRDRDVLALTTNEDGFGVLHVYEAISDGWAEAELPEIEPGVVSVQDLEGRTLIYSLSNARTPGVAFRWEVGETAPPEQITVADGQGFDFASFILPELVKYESFDALQVPALLYLPEGYEQGTSIPFIIQYHGGPEGQHRPYFSSTTQYYLKAGYGVMRPNVRGSTGYGRSFHQMDNAELRWDSVRDGWHAARWLVENGYAEPGRIASMGGSYGGFMASAIPIEDTRQAAARESEPLFGASINIVGIVNFKTFLERTKDYRRKLREAEYGSLDKPDFLESVSPLTHVDQINVPMLIAHGLNDPRVPIDEAMQLAEGLQRRGLDPEQVYFYDEGHGFAKLDNRLLFYERVVRFLDKHIGEGATEPRP